MDIFLSYRRADSMGNARLLFRELAQRFSRERIFFDQHSIESGDVFPQRLESGVAEAKVVVVLIGPRWLGPRNARRMRRLDDPKDFVRFEIRRCLELGKKLIPVLLDGARMPDAVKLPDEIRQLASHDALPLGGKGFEYQSQLSELVRLIAKALGVQPPPAESGRNSFPPITQPILVGRTEDRAKVRQLLSNRLVTVTGTAGIGKTRLAQEVGWDIWQQYAGNAWWLTLEGLPASTGIWTAAAAQLGLHDQGVPMKAVLDYLAPRTALLVLDACEHLLSECARFAASVLRECPRVTILTASEETLGQEVLDGAVWTLQTLSFPRSPEQPGSVRELGRFDAVRLFVERAALVDPKFALDDATKIAVAQICHRLAGIPLAIELAARLKRALSLAEILEDLDAGGVVGRLDSVLESSYRRLEDAAVGALFSRLCVFADSFTRETAREVCSGGIVGKGAVYEQLARLCDKSLVIRNEVDGQSRFALLGPIRKFAARKLRSADMAGLRPATGGPGDGPPAEPAEADLRDRHAAHCLALAIGAEARHRTAGRRAATRLLELEMPELRQALEWSIERPDAETSLRLSGALYWFWNQCGLWAEGIGWLDRALGAADGSETPVARALALYARGGLHWLSRRYGQAREDLDASIRLWAAAGTAGLEGRAHALLVRGAVEQDEGGPGSLQRANAFRVQSRRLFHRAGLPWGEALALLDIGKAIAEPERAAKVREIYARGQRLFERTGDDWGIGLAMQYRAYKEFERPDLGAALALGTEALVRLRLAGDKGALTDALINQVQFLQTQGDPAARERCELLLDEASTLAEQLGNQGFLEAIGERRRQGFGRDGAAGRP